jgi:hypothetical protein
MSKIKMMSLFYHNIRWKFFHNSSVIVFLLLSCIDICCMKKITMNSKYSYINKLCCKILFIIKTYSICSWKDEIKSIVSLTIFVYPELSNVQQYTNQMDYQDEKVLYYLTDQLLLLVYVNHHLEVLDKWHEQCHSILFQDKNIHLLYAVRQYEMYSNVLKDC